jgi:hypothetical protein
MKRRKKPRLLEPGLKERVRAFGGGGAALNARTAFSLACFIGPD